ncbi:MAG: hypothetical protein WC647_10060 [Desulfomonilaceae bacterium]|jgi:hypothetical protein
MSVIVKIPEISDKELTPSVAALSEIVQIQQELIQGLRDEIARLKGNNPRPRIKPSTLGESINKGTQRRERRRAKRNKTERVEIHETLVVEARNVPIGSTFKGYEDFTVQDLLLQPFNTLYQRERRRTAQFLKSV